jgi:hypothetical protein
MPVTHRATRTAVLNVIGALAALAPFIQKLFREAQNRSGFAYLKDWIIIDDFEWFGRFQTPEAQWNLRDRRRRAALACCGLNDLSLALVGVGRSGPNRSELR